MLSLEVGRGTSNSSSCMAPRIRDEAQDRLRAISTGLTLGLESTPSSFLMMRSSSNSGSCRREDHLQPELLNHHHHRAFPVQLDLLPRAPLNNNTSQSGPVSCVSQLTSRNSLFSSGVNHPAAAIDCEAPAAAAAAPAPENHSSSRGGSPGPRGLDMNEVPVEADVISSPRSCSISPPNAAFPFEIARKGESSSVNIKRERERASDGEADRANCEVSSRGSDEEDGAPRKKLRLSKEQSALLEESFKEHSTLNPKQKNALAKQLNLKPRQVEVWFQNRRARTKLKQTEIDCELLKRCCETLTEENRRLQKELQELRAIKVPPPCVISQDFYMPLPAATLTMCPSCERLAAVDNRSGHTFTASKAHQQQHHHHHQPPPSFFAPAQPPAACQS